MEKIYEENQQQNQQQQQRKQKKKIKIDGVTMLSFAVAIFAIVSLIAAGVSSFSYAAPTPTNYGESFEGKNGAEMFDDQSKELELEYHYTTINGANLPLFCLERDISFEAGQYENSNSTSVSDDAGLFYILSKIAVEDATWDLSDINNVNGNTSDPQITDELVKYWAGQAAIWYYLNNTTNNSANTDATSKFPEVKKVSTTEYQNQDLPNNANYFESKTSKTIFESIKVDGMTISTLIANAKDSSKNNVSFAINLSDGDGTVSTDDEKKYYFSPLYTVTPVISDPKLGNLVNYSVSVVAVDEQNEPVNVDAVITKENGEVVEDTEAINIADVPKFYVRLAADKLNGAASVTVNVTGNFQAYDGLVYTSTQGDYQRVAALRFVNKSVNTGKTFDLASAPDTGISAGQTIYFVGLIVLLCGVGIIYANAKPKQQVQN